MTVPSGGREVASRRGAKRKRCGGCCTAHGKTSRRGRFVRLDSEDSDDAAAPDLGPHECVHNGQT